MIAFDSALKSSLESGRGVQLHVSGTVIVLVVTAFDDLCVTGRNQASSTIAVRRDRIDAVSTLF
jgi:hypothetical protein